MWTPSDISWQVCVVYSNHIQFGGQSKDWWLIGLNQKWDLCLGHNEMRAGQILVYEEVIVVMTDHNIYLGEEIRTAGTMIRWQDQHRRHLCI